MSKTLSSVKSTKNVLKTPAYINPDEKQDLKEKLKMVEQKTEKKKSFNYEIDISKFEGLEDIIEKEPLEKATKDVDELLIRPYFPLPSANERRDFKEYIWSTTEQENEEEKDKLSPLHLKIKATAKIAPITGFPKLLFVKPPLDTIEKGDKTVYFTGYINFPNDNLPEKFEKGVVVLFWTNIFFQITSPFDIPVNEIKYILLDRFAVKKIAIIRDGKDKDIPINFEFPDKDSKIDFLDHVSDCYYSHKRQFPEIMFVDALPILFDKFFGKSLKKNPEEVLYIDEKKDKIKLGSNSTNEMGEIFAELVKLGDSEVLFTDNVIVEYTKSQQAKKKTEFINILESCNIILTDTALYIYPSKDSKLPSRRIPYEDFERIITQKTEGVNPKLEIIIKVPLDYDVYILIAPANDDFINILQNQIFIGIGVQNIESNIKKSAVYVLKEEEKLQEYSEIVNNFKKLQNAKQIDFKALVKNIRKIDRLIDQKKDAFYKDKEAKLLLENSLAMIQNERKKIMNQEIFNEAVKSRDIKTLLLINNIQNTNKEDTKWIKFFKGDKDDNYDKTIPPNLYKMINEEYLLFTISKNIKNLKMDEKEIQKQLSEAKSWGLIKQAEELSYIYNEEIQKNEVLTQLRDCITENSFDFQKLSISIQAGALLPSISKLYMYQDILYLYPLFKSLDELSRATLSLRNQTKESLLKICEESSTKDELSGKLVDFKDKLSLLNSEKVEKINYLLKTIEIKTGQIKLYKMGEYHKRQQLKDLESMIQKRSKSDEDSKVMDFIDQNSEIIKLQLEAKKEIERQDNIDFKVYFDIWEDLQMKKKNKGIYEDALTEALNNYQADKIEEIFIGIGHIPEDPIKKEKIEEMLKEWNRIRFYFLLIASSMKMIKEKENCQDLLNIILSKRDQFHEFLFHYALEKYNIEKDFIQKVYRDFELELQKIQKKKDVETRLFNALLTLDPLSIKNAMIAVKTNESYDTTLRASLSIAEKIITSNEAKMNFIAENLQDAINQNDREKLTKLIKIAPRFKGLRSLVEQAKRQLEDVKKLKEQITKIIEDKDPDSLDEILEENEPYLVHYDEWEEYNNILLQLRNGRNYKISDFRQRLNVAISQRDKTLLSETIQYVEQRIMKPKNNQLKTNDIYAILDDAKRLLSNMNEYFINDLESAIINLDHQDEIILTSHEATSIMDIIDTRKKKKHHHLEKLEEEIKEFEKEKSSDKVQKLSKVISLTFFDKMKKQTFWDILISHSSIKIQQYAKQFKQLYPKVIEPFSLSLLFIHFILTKGIIIDILKEFVSNDLQPYYESESILRNVKYRDDLYNTFDKLKSYNFDLNFDDLYLVHIVSRIKENVKSIIEAYKTPKKERNDSWNSKLHYYVYTELTNELKALLIFGTYKSIDLWDLIEQVTELRRKSSVDYGGILLPQLVDEINDDLKEKSKKFKCFIGLALSKNALGDILSSILNTETLQYYYTKDAIVNDPKSMKKIYSFLSTLSKIDFKIKF